MLIKQHNMQVDGSDVPLAVGDRQYAQDKFRDFWHLKEYASKILEDLLSEYANNIIITGCIGSQGAGHTLSWTAGRVKVPHTVKTPTDWSALPPPMTSHTIPVTIDIPAMTNQSITGATTDGVTVNYAKFTYNESGTSTRQRAKKAGTYDSEINPTYTFTCNSTVPTANEVAFATFTTDGATLTFISISNRDNTIFGFNSLLNNTTGSYNSVFGREALYSNTIGINNNAFGFKSLYSNTTGINNSAFGVNSLTKNTVGVNNSSFGSGSLSVNTTGKDNCAFGYNSLAANIVGERNSTFGYSSLAVNTASYNNAFGYNALVTNTTGSSNCAFGNSTLESNIGGAFNQAFGSYALRVNNGSNNNAFGYNTLDANTTGSSNCAFGNSALGSNITGTENSAFGHTAMSDFVTGTNSMCLGNNAQASSTTTSNEITLGNSNITKLRCQVTTITALSDKRDKADIENLTLGLDFINSIRPVRFHWDKREDYKDKKPNGKMKSKDWYIGVIAQELDEVQKEFKADWLRLVEHNNPDRIETSEGKLFMVIIKAIQELSAKLDRLKK